VYFVQVGFDGPIKIGVAVDMDKRMRQLQAGCPYTLFLLAIMPGGREQERELHDRFALYWMHHEWFEPVAPIYDYVELIRADFPSIQAISDWTTILDDDREVGAEGFSIIRSQALVGEKIVHTWERA
jgi:hypothetical protein